MRTFRLSLGIAATAALLASPLSSSAQRNVRRSSPRRNVATPESSDALRSSAKPASNKCTVNCDDYSLAVVSALLPSETAGVSSDVVTLVIENRGTAEAPASVISVAPRNHLALVRWSSIPMLAPGQRATVQLPVEIGPDGTPCISITITPAPAVDPAVARFLAAVIPDPQIGSDDLGALAVGDSWTGFPRFDAFDRFGDFNELSDW